MQLPKLLLIPISRFPQWFLNIVNKIGLLKSSKPFSYTESQQLQVHNDDAIFFFFFTDSLLRADFQQIHEGSCSATVLKPPHRGRFSINEIALIPHKLAAGNGQVGGHLSRHLSFRMRNSLHQIQVLMQGWAKGGVHCTAPQVKSERSHSITSNSL